MVSVAVSARAHAAARERDGGLPAGPGVWGSPPTLSLIGVNDSRSRLSRRHELARPDDRVLALSLDDHVLGKHAGPAEAGGQEYSGERLVVRGAPREGAEDA